MGKEVLFISNFMGHGGAARVISVLAEEMLRRGLDVSVCSFPFNKEEYSKIQGVTYTLLAPRFTKGIKKKLERILLLRKEIRKHKEAVIISFEYFLNMQVICAALGFKNRLIVSERMDPAISGGQRFFTKHLRDFLYRFCDSVVVQTNDAKEYFPEYLQNKIKIIENPIKTNLPARWEGERDHTVVTFCRIEKQKNLPLLIDAFSEFSISHPDYKLEIYGDGSEKDHIERYIHENAAGKQVELHSAIENVHEHILKDAMFVSTSDYEGMSNSMLEAMAIGLPTICTDCPCGGARAVIEDGKNGLLIPVGSKSDLIVAMERIADSPELAERLSINGSAIRNKLAPGAIVESWLSAF